jgi:hypothetical protein
MTEESTQGDQVANDDAELMYKMQMAIHGLNGIFWALNVLVVNNGADCVVSDVERKNGVACLITAGRELARAISDDF